MEESLVGRYCLAKLDEIIATVAAMDDETANTALDVPGSNSPYQILEHCLGMLREWTKDQLLGEPTGRDRDAEFVARGSVAELVARAGRVRAELEADLARIDPTVPVRTRAADRFWGSSAEGVLLHVLEELSQHLGHLEITRDVLAAPTSRLRPPTCLPCQENGRTT